MKTYAVIDTNVLVSALMSRHHDSATVRVIEHLLEGDVIPVYNDEKLQEYGEVLRRPKFSFPCVLLQAARNKLLRIPD